MSRYLAYRPERVRFCRCVWTRCLARIIFVFSCIVWWSCWICVAIPMRMRPRVVCCITEPDAEGMALRVCAGGDEFAAAGAAHSRGSGVRYLAGGAEPDFWSLNAFRRRHGRALNDSFTQVLELARQMGLRQMGTVAIDATRIKASASPDKIIKHRYVKVRAMRLARGERLEARLKVRRWQQACDADDPNENAGSRIDASPGAIEQMPPALTELPRPAREKIVRRSATDPDARFLRGSWRPLRAWLHGRDRRVSLP